VEEAMAVKGKKKAVKKSPAAKKAVKKPAKKTVKKAVKKIVKKAVKKEVKKPVVKKPAVKKAPAVKKTAARTPAAVETPVFDASAPGMSRVSCEVVEMSGNSFVVVVNRARNFFTLDEMKIMVRLSHMAANENDGAGRLYKWLKAYRSDVLNDTDIHYATDTALISIYRYLVSHYSVKG
jgi:hypothetical protein